MKRGHKDTTPRKLRAKAKKASIRTLEVSECAEQLEIPVELLQDYAMRGCPHDKGGRGKSNLFDAGEVLTWMRENNLTGQRGRPSAAGDSKDIEQARLRKENALASKYELHVKREMEELIPAVEVKQFGVRMLGTFRNRVRGIPSTASPQLEGRDAAERESILARLFDECLNDLADAVQELCGSIKTA